MVALCCPGPLAARLLLLRSDVRQGEKGLAAAQALYDEAFFAEYRPAVAWWEAWMLLRRVVLLAVFVALVPKLGLAVAKAAAAMCIAGLLAVQLVVRPFREERANLLEVFALSMLLLLVARQSRRCCSWCCCVWRPRCCWHRS